MFRWTRGGAEDRWHGIAAPGGYEWWGFEALDTERELAFSLRISAGDPMDPVYAGLLARDNGRVLALPDRHLLVRAVLYRRRRRVFARTFRPSPETFRASSSSGAVAAGPVQVRVEERAVGRLYRVDLDPEVSLTFEGPGGEPASRGTLTEPVWDLAPLDLKVTGAFSLPAAGGRRESLSFSGRGVHDHGAGPSSPVPAVRSWAWGWAHAWEFAVGWRQVVLETGEIDTVLLVDRDGRPYTGEPVRSRRFRPRYSVLGVPHSRQWRLDAPSGVGLAVERAATLASSPVGMRFLTNIRLSVQDDRGPIRLVDGLGLSSVARPIRARRAAWRWLSRARDLWNGQRARG